MPVWSDSVATLFRRRPELLPARSPSPHSGSIHTGIIGLEPQEHAGEIHSVFFGHVQYSPKYRYIYVDTPKVACSTIKHSLQRAEREGAVPGTKPGAPQQYGYSDFLLRIHDRRESPLLFPKDRQELARFAAWSRFDFCFVRNPFSRVLSAYIDKVERHAERRALFQAQLLGGMEDPGRTLSFIEFLELVRRQDPKAMDPHWRPQHIHISCGIRYDFIGFFENFEKDFNTALSRIDPELLQHRANIFEHRTDASKILAKYYEGNAAARLVREMYAKDFEIFGYDDDVRRAAEPPKGPRGRAFL